MSTDEEVKRVIELMAVPGKTGVYVLGSFARYATLYSQQVRALNLIYALNKTKKLGVNKTVAIIGGGAAGLTAAVAAARVGAKVTLLEKLAEPMGVQRNSSARYLHPHIYDWPLTKITSRNAGLPIFDWEANYAKEVAHHFLTEWAKERSRYPRHLEIDCGVREIGIKQASGEKQATVSWNADGPDYGEFDSVILAVGFGTEDGHGYWEDDALNTEKLKAGKERRCLVSGYGDGGLTDLMRLCILNFEHHKVLELFAKHEGSEAIGASLLEQEKHYLATKDRTAISEFYRTPVPQFQEILTSKNMLRTDTEVFLTGHDVREIYSSKSSILNRFIVGQLARMNRWHWIDGPIEPDPTFDNKAKHFIVRFKSAGTDYSEKPYDIVVMRHGPKSVLEEEFDGIWKACRMLDEQWKKMPPHLDPTRRPLPWGKLFDLPRPPSPESSPLPKPGQFKLVAFDVDGTLLQGEYFTWSWALVWSFLRFSDSVRRNLMNKYLDKVEAGEEGWHDAYQAWCDEAAEKFKERGLNQSHFAEIAKTLRPVVGLKETIQVLKDAGIRLAIISGGIDQIVTEKLADYIDAFDHYFINKFLFDSQGLFTGVKASPYDFKGKWEAVQKICADNGLSPKEAVFVGDGFNDVHVLGNVGRTICFASVHADLGRRAEINIPPGNPSDLREILPYILPSGR
jgi:HAD superfamily phosphoserine phosphatase-like hydrolase